MIGAQLNTPDNFIQAPGFSQSLNRYSYCWNNPLKYTDPSGQKLGVENNRKFFWWAYRGSSNSSCGIGPGSNNHWSDPYRDKDGDFMLMTSRVFDNKHGHGAWDNYFKKWNKHAGFEVNRKYTDNGVEISYSGKWVSHSTSYYGAESEEDGNNNWGVYAAGVTLTAEDLYNNFGHNHTTYRTTKGLTKNIYQPNGAMRSARAAQFAKLSFIVKVLGNVGTGLMVATSSYNIASENGTGLDYADATVGALGLINAGALQWTTYGIPFVGQAVAGYAGARLFYDATLNMTNYYMDNNINPGIQFIYFKE